MLKCLEEDFGYTGGTIDKLESIPGYNTNLNEIEFVENVKKIEPIYVNGKLSLWDYPYDKN